MTQHSYTGLRAYLARQEADFGHLGPSRESSAKAGLHKALARSRGGIGHLSGAEIAAQLSDEQRRAIAAKLGVKGTPAKAARSDSDQARAEGIAKGRAEIRTAIKAVLGSPESRGHERVALEALANGLSAKSVLAELRNHKARAGQTTAKADEWSHIHAEIAEEKGLVANMKARFGLDGDK